MWDMLAPYKTLIEGFNIPSGDALLGNLLKQTDSSGTLNIPNTSFLKSMIKQQEETVKTLLNTAKKIGPVAKQIYQKERAYDASFESNNAASIPLTSSTMQGAAILLFLISYLILAILLTAIINKTTGSGMNAAISFAGFIVVGVICLSLIIRLG